MDIKQAFERGLDLFDSVIHQVDGDQWTNPTPCAEWTARELTAHVLGVLRMAERITRREAPAAFPEPVDPGADPQAAWERVRTSVRTEVAGADPSAELDTALGKRPMSDVLGFAVLDLHVHSWDLAQATGTELQLSDEAVEWCEHFLRALPQEAMRGPNTFAAEQPAPAGADRTTRLMAFAGRQVQA